MQRRSKMDLNYTITASNECRARIVTMLEKCPGTRLVIHLDDLEDNEMLRWEDDEE
jgi:hypothetical protein